MKRYIAIYSDRFSFIFTARNIKSAMEISRNYGKKFKLNEPREVLYYE